MVVGVVVSVVVVSVVVCVVVGVVRLHLDSSVPSKNDPMALFTCFTVASHCSLARK